MGIPMQQPARWAEELLQALEEEDLELARGHLVDHCWKLVSALRIASDLTESADARQDTWVRILERIPKLLPFTRNRPPGRDLETSILVWVKLQIHDVKRETRKKYWLRWGNHDDPSVLDALQDRAGPLSVEERLDAARLPGALKKLGEKDRLVLLLHSFGYTFPKIGEIMECSEDAARKRHNRAVGKLKKMKG